MELLNIYCKFLNRYKNKWMMFFLLGLIIIINFIIFPALKIPEEKLLDVRLYYTPHEAVDYSQQLTKNDIRISIIMHSSVDIIYPCVYTLFLSSIILYLKGGKRLVSISLLIFTADILENLSIIFLLIIPNQSIFLKIPAYIGSAATPLKWASFAICFVIILFLGIKRLYKK